MMSEESTGLRSEYLAAVKDSNTGNVTPFVDLFSSMVWESQRDYLRLLQRLHYQTVDGSDVIRYDNERGKGDHRHFEGKEEPCRFESVKRLALDIKLCMLPKWVASNLFLNVDNYLNVRRNDSAGE